MTRKELSRIYWLEREIKELEEELSELEASIGVKGLNMDGMPHGSSPGRPTEAMALQIDELYEKIKEHYNQIKREKIAVWNFIETIDDPILRQIIRWRCVKPHSWTFVGMKLNMPADTCRKIFDRAIDNGDDDDKRVRCKG